MFCVLLLSFLLSVLLHLYSNNTVITSYYQSLREEEAIERGTDESPSRDTQRSRLELYDEALQRISYIRRPPHLSTAFQRKQDWDSDSDDT